MWLTLHSNVVVSAGAEKRGKKAEKTEQAKISKGIEKLSGSIYLFEGATEKCRLDKVTHRYL